MGLLRRHPDGERYLIARSCSRSATTLDRERRRGTRLQGERQGAAHAADVVLEDPAGDELAKIQERKLSIRDKIAIERGDETAPSTRR